MMETPVIVISGFFLCVIIFALFWLSNQNRLLKSQLQQLITEKISQSHAAQLVHLSELHNKGVDRATERQVQQAQQLTDMGGVLTDKLNESNALLQAGLNKHREAFDERQLAALKLQQDHLTQGMTQVRQQVTEALTSSGDEMGKKLEALTRSTDARLKEISGQVDKRLSDGFEKTTATFTDVVKRLAQIDEAQKKITELSTNVVSLQEVLADKRSRGAFGEVQLNALVRNVMPESSYAFQHTFKNKSRVDCLLFLPEPSGNIAIDAKFPLESYRTMTDISVSDDKRKAADKQFKKDIKKHINDIASKYIIANETAEGAVMFIPAEAVFAEIHAHHYDLVEVAQRARVWLVSPTTLMAVLTTARAVLKDSATREQVHLIQVHLVSLAKDFSRFQTRMDSLSRHIEKANNDVNDVNTSARKITARFEKIEKVDLHDERTASAFSNNTE